MPIDPNPVGGPEALAATPSYNDKLPFRAGGFQTVVEALEYAADGETGYNFFNLRGEVTARLSYRDVRDQAKALAARLAGRYERKSRIAIVAETSPSFIVAFYACQYAGLAPAPMPMNEHINVGSILRQNRTL